MDMIIFGISGMAVIGVMATLIKTEHNKEKEIKKLDEEIDRKKHTLLMLEQNIDNMTIDRTVSLTKLEIEVLNIYDDSNIRIPTDIIEDLSNMKLTSEKDMMNFIEIQRRYWKLENTKKPFVKENK